MLRTLLKSFLKPNTNLILPDSLRERLSKPIGNLFTPKGGLTAEEQVQQYLVNKKLIVYFSQNFQFPIIGNR